MNRVIPHKLLPELILALEAQFTGGSFTGEEYCIQWAQEVVLHLSELSPQLTMEHATVLNASAKAFNDIFHSDNLPYLISDLLNRPDKFARTLLLMTGAPRLQPWQRVSLAAIPQ